MSILTPVPPSLPWYARAFFAIPVVGWMARDVAFGGVENIYYALVVLLTLLVIAIKMFGIVALSMVAVALVPVCFVLLIAISRG